MRDKKKQALRLEGRGVVLEEIRPEFFVPIIRWRNDPVLNHFLNQPEPLTMEKESAWYEQRYLTDPTQGFLIMVDKETGRPFGTFGWTDLDTARRQCIAGRLLLGDPAYKNSGPFLESFFLHGAYLYQFVDRMYAHIGVENRKAPHLNCLLGFRRHQDSIQYPEELFVQGDHARPQVEYVRTKEAFEQVKETLFASLSDVPYDA